MWVSLNHLETWLEWRGWSKREFIHSLCKTVFKGGQTSVLSSLQDWFRLGLELIPSAHLDLKLADFRSVSAYVLSLVQLFATPWTAAHQALLSMGFPRQEYRSELPFSSPGQSFLSRNQTHVSCVSYIGRQILYWANWEDLTADHAVSITVSDSSLQ